MFVVPWVWGLNFVTHCVSVQSKITGQSRQILFEWLPPQTQDLHRFFLIFSARWHIRQDSIDGWLRPTRTRCRLMLQLKNHQSQTTFPWLLRFVRNAARLIGYSLTLQHARAKSWIALSCIHANLVCHCVAVRQRNTYNARDSIRNTDILIGQLKIDSGLTNQ